MSAATIARKLAEHRRDYAPPRLHTRSGGAARSAAMHGARVLVSLAPIGSAFMHSNGSTMVLRPRSVHTNGRRLVFGPGGPSAGPAIGSCSRSRAAAGTCSPLPTYARTATPPQTLPVDG